MAGVNVEVGLLPGIAIYVAVPSHITQARFVKHDENNGRIRVCLHDKSVLKMEKCFLSFFVILTTLSK